MAPNKKKKKPASNPARGFATVSVASKIKGPDPVDEAASSTTTEAAANGADVSDLPDLSTGARKNVPHADSATAIEDMTPEELEAHLEDSELQTLLDANSTACKSDATRQVSRLHAERRQLRAPAYKLNTRAWLEDEATDGVLLTSSISLRTLSVPASNSFSSNDSKRLLDLWVLQRVLSALRLNHVSDVVTYLVLLAMQGEVATDTGLIWGLAEAFEWYAQHASVNELPDYDTERKEDALPSEDILPQQIGKGISPFQNSFSASFSTHSANSLKLRVFVVLSKCSGDLYLCVD